MEELGDAGQQSTARDLGLLVGQLHAYQRTHPSKTELTPLEERRPYRFTTCSSVSEQM
jgi:hypothetical protein